MRLLLMAVFILTANTCFALEADYAKKFCDEAKGHREYRIEKVRIDCVNDHYAIEVEFAHKWAESIGQALYYGLITQKQPAVALIVGPGENRFLLRLQTVASAYDIVVWKIEK